MGKMVLVMGSIRGERVLSSLSAGEGVGVLLNSKPNEGTILGNWLVDTESGFLPRRTPIFPPASLTQASLLWLKWQNIMMKFLQELGLCFWSLGESMNLEIGDYILCEVSEGRGF